jgi:Holliday junction resolvasome RuvABC endonuclease subunit
MAGELGGIVKLSLYSYFNDCQGQYPLIVPPTNLKKYVAGKGNGVSKSQMLLHVYKKWDAEFTDDNAADSYALAHLVSGSYSLAYEKEVYEKLQDPKFREK